ncbi:MAG TPA: response regulator [Clostridia bacterium]|nr:response regulator [Clostridia bacterium]
MTEPAANNPESRNRAQTLIYVVDDEAMLLELAAVILEPAGYEVKTFRDPESALEAFTNANPRPALLITDYAMHTMTGMDLIQACRRLEPAQKVLLVSGTVGPEVFFQSPFKPNSFLAKPYHAKQLTDLVKSLVGV